MEQETLFTASKWDILKILSSGSKSPLELAKLSNTSVANISQQLRLLEMAGLVHSRRISNRDKGQPRLLYSLAGNHSFLIASATDFVDKKFLRLSEYNKIILKIWFLSNPELHYYLEKAFWQVEQYINSIDAIFLNLASKEEIELMIISESPNLKKELKTSVIKNPEGAQKTILFNCQSPNELKKLASSELSALYSLYDPSSLLISKKDGGLVFDKKDEKKTIRGVR